MSELDKDIIITIQKEEEVEEQQQQSIMNEIDININECKVNSVTVYKDRAEIIRTLSFIPTCNGEIKIIINSLTMTSNPESIRVTGIKTCKIIEVSHDIVNKKITNESLNMNDNLNEFKSKLILLEKEKLIINKDIERLNKEKILTECYTTNILSNVNLSNQNCNLDDAIKILSFHSKSMSSFDNNDLELNNKLNYINDEIKIYKQKLTDISSTESFSESNNNMIKHRIVAMVVNSIGNVNETCSLQLSYVVSDATWVPSYDIRINSIDSSLELTYYAEVIQKSGDDWNDCNLFLSTSNPAIGSSPPPLASKTVNFMYKNYGNLAFESKSFIKNSKSFGSNYNSNRRGSNYSDDDDDINSRASLDLIEDHVQSSTFLGMTARELPLRNASTAGIKGSGDAGSTVFTIDRKIFIASDSKPHKVTVAIENFIPQLVHYVAPSAVPATYLQAKTQNTSLYPLLPSEKVSIFLDGNFISTSSIKQASPGEFFTVFLGVDPSVKIEYLPCHSTTKSKGWLSGTQLKKFNFSTFITNTKKFPIKCIIAELLPRSSNDKIVIELLEPSQNSLIKPSDNVLASSEHDLLSNIDGFNTTSQDDSINTGFQWPNDFVSQNKHTNNIVWLKTLQPGEKKEIKFNYRVLWPTSQDIDLK
jgi:hypothetical protein